MRLSLYNIQAVIIATALFHNICRYYNIEEVPPEVEKPEESEITVTSENSDSFKNDIRHRQELDISISLYLYISILNYF